MEININSNKFDNDIIQRQSYKIIKDSSIQRNSNMKSNNNLNYIISNNNFEDEFNNYENDEDKNINLNININNYLSKKNININSNAPINNINYTLKNQPSQQNQQKLKKYNTDLTKGYLIRHLNKNQQPNNNYQNYQKDYKYNNIKETKEELKSKLISKMSKQKPGPNNYDFQKIDITTKKGKLDSNSNKDINKEKEQNKRVPKILTFLQTFKNMSLPLKFDKTKKKENEVEDKNIITNKEKNNKIGGNNIKYNFNYIPLMRKVNTNNNTNNQRKNEKIIDKNNDEEYIDYNRFTFRNYGDENNSPFGRKNKRDKKIKIKNKEKERDAEVPKYSEDSSDSDINKNINIDAYQRKLNNKNKKVRNKYWNKSKQIKQINNNYNKFKRKNNSEEFSPEFKQDKNIQTNLIPKKVNNTPYLRKNILKEKYNSPRPLHKNEIKNKKFYTKDNISEKNRSRYQNENLDSGNESDNSFRSLNPSKIYRKQILNNSFQINDNINLMNSNSYYYNNDRNVDEFNSENNYYAINRPNKYRNTKEILINLNDDEDSFNSAQNFNPRKNLRINRSPINRKDNYNNNQLMNRSPYSAKQINQIPYDYSDFYESQNEEESYNKNNKNTNYSRFMQPFEPKKRTSWFNEDSYLSYDLEKQNIKTIQNRFKNNTFVKHNNKSNSMYIKQIVPYENKKNSFLNDSDSFSHKNNTDFIEKNRNVNDFDAPKSVNDFLEDKFSSNSSLYMNETSRDNKISFNSDFPSERNKKDLINKNNQALSFREEEKPKMIYSKKLSTMHNFYQGTKKLFSNINNKFLKMIKKEDKKQEQNNKDNNIKNKNNTYLGKMTPRMENEDDNIFFGKQSEITPKGYDNRIKIIKDKVIIKEKINCKKKCFYQKFYNHFIKTPEIKNIGFYFSCQKTIKTKPKKKKINIPESFLKFFKKGRPAKTIKSIKIPLIKMCFFEKFYLIRVMNDEKTNEIKRLKNNLLVENQTKIILSKNSKQEKKNYNDEKNDFSLFNKNSFESQNIKPDNIWNISFINKQTKNKDNKKYQYEYILSLKNNKLSLNKDLLPKNILEHFKQLKEPIDLININLSLEKDINKKYKREEIEKIAKRYMKPKKLETNGKIQNEENDKWKRSDFTKETEQAEKYIKELNEKMEENNINNNIIGMLNILTLDNMNDVLNKIMNLITRNENNFILSDEEIIKNEYILMKAILNKAIMETRFVNIYAKLCKELCNKLNNVSNNKENLKTIIIAECKRKFSELITNENILKNKIISIDDEKLFLTKKTFLGNIDFISELINFDSLEEELGFYYLEELKNIYNNDSSEQIDKYKKNIALEATVNFLSKFGKKLFSGKNTKNIQILNNFININLKSILDNKDLSGFLKYKIINLIEKQKNKWKDSLFEKSILAKSKNNKYSSNNKKTRKRKHSNKSLKIFNQKNTINNQNIKNNSKENKSLNSSTISDYSQINLKLNTSINNSNIDEEMIKLIEQDLPKYKTFLNKNNIYNKIDLSKNIQIGNEFDWSQIEEILSQNKINLAEIIRCYIEVCIDEIFDSTDIYIVNDYIKSIIYYYSNELTQKEKDIIHNKIINLFLGIRDICIDNNNMKEIMGYLLYILIENKLFFIKDLNRFIGLETEIIITIAEIIRYSIISSGEKCKKYHNDFKQTKLFVDNPIFYENITNIISDLLK